MIYLGVLYLSLILLIFTEDLSMASPSSHVKSAVLVVIIGETVLQNRIVELFHSLGITGYTVSQAQGAGRHGSRQSDLAGYNTNIEIKTIVSLPISDEILAGLVKYQADHALIAFRQKVDTLSGFDVI